MIKKRVFMYKSRGKKGKNFWSLPCIFGSKDLTGKIKIKIIINTITQIRDKTANATLGQLEFER